MLSAHDRFLSYVAEPDQNGCLLWTGTLVRGYGQLHVQGRLRSVHRLAWEFAHGPIPEGMKVLHHCDTPACVNPDDTAHLFLGTQADNMADMKAKGRKRFPLGEATYNARLTADQVRAIRGAAASGTSQYVLAREFGVSRTTVQGIVNRRTWRWL